MQTMLLIVSNCCLKLKKIFEAFLTILLAMWLLLD
jgi:hypothetical protein